jgi:hypothetical protein
MQLRHLFRSLRKSPEVDDPLLWNAPEAAKQLGLAVERLQALTFNEQVPTVLIGNDVRYSPAALRKWVAKHGRPARRQARSSRPLFIGRRDERTNG